MSEQIGETASEPSKDRDNSIAANARREFVSVFGDLARGKRNWQVIAFVLVGIVVIQSIATMQLASAARVVPYIVRVDRLGQVRALGAAEPMRDPDADLVASQLAEFVRAVRTVLPASAASAQAALLRHGYAFATPEAAGFLNTYFGDPTHDPRVLGARLTREVDITSVLRVPDAARQGHQTGAFGIQTWRVQWTEIERPTEPGDSTRTLAWEGYLTVRIVPPTRTESVQENPLGLSITSITWTRLAQRKGSDSTSNTSSTSTAGDGIP